MKKNKNLWNVLYILAFVIIAFIGVNKSIGFTRGEFNPPIYYTTLSGLICLLYFLPAAVRGVICLIKKEEFPDSLFIVPRFKGAVTICITVTLLIYHFLVYEGPFYTVDTDIYNLISHYIVPIMVILHWLIFDKSKTYKKIDPLLWTVIPISYFTWANIVALMHTETPYWGEGMFYPYGFMDLTKNSLGTVVITVIILIIFFVALGYGVYYIDNKVKK